VAGAEAGGAAVSVVGPAVAVGRPEHDAGASVPRPVPFKLRRADPDGELLVRWLLVEWPADKDAPTSQNQDPPLSTKDLRFARCIDQPVR